RWRVGMQTSCELTSGRGRVVGRVLFWILDDLLLPVVLAGMHLFELGLFPEGPHRRRIDAAFRLVDPPRFGCGATPLSQERRHGGERDEYADGHRCRHLLRHRVSP